MLETLRTSQNFFESIRYCIIILIVLSFINKNKYLYLFKYKKLSTDSIKVIKKLWKSKNINVKLEKLYLFKFQKVYLMFH